MRAVVEVSEAYFSIHPDLLPLAQADWTGLANGPHLVYLLAHARRDPYYIDVAEHAEALEARRRRICLEQEATLPEAQRLPPLLVWFEVVNDEARAQARAAELRALPHAWQRQLVQAMNPGWLDLRGIANKLSPSDLSAVAERRPEFRDLTICVGEPSPPAT